VLARFEYDHPIMDQPAIDAQRALPEIQGGGGVWYAGAWTGYGFHEDGLKSALRIAAAFDAAPHGRRCHEIASASPTGPCPRDACALAAGAEPLRLSGVLCAPESGAARSMPVALVRRRPRRPLSLRTRDYGPRDGSDLELWMRTLLAEQGIAADGEIWLQTFPRVLGYAFNPSAWHCHDAHGRLRAVLAEVNTFGETHRYLLRWPTRAAPRIKQMRVAVLPADRALRIPLPHDRRRRAPASITTTTTAC
jgi:hypothetical protein